MHCKNVILSNQSVSGKIGTDTTPHQSTRMLGLEFEKLVDV